MSVLSRRRVILAELGSRWPALFSPACVAPLALKIDAAIWSEMKDSCSRRELKDALRHWVSRSEYLASLSRGEVRRNLDGSETAPPTPQEIERAKAMLADRESASRQQFQQGLLDYKRRRKSAIQKTEAKEPPQPKRRSALSSAPSITPDQIAASVARLKSKKAEALTDGISTSNVSRP